LKLISLCQIIADKGFTTYYHFITAYL